MEKDFGQRPRNLGDPADEDKSMHLSDSSDPPRNSSHIDSMQSFPGVKSPMVESSTKDSNASTPSVQGMNIGNPGLRLHQRSSSDT